VLKRSTAVARRHVPAELCRHPTEPDAPPLLRAGGLVSSNFNGSHVESPGQRAGPGSFQFQLGDALKRVDIFILLHGARPAIFFEVTDVLGLRVMLVLRLRTRPML